MWAFPTKKGRFNRPIPFSMKEKETAGFEDKPEHMKSPLLKSFQVNQFSILPSLTSAWFTENQNRKCCRWCSSKHNFLPAAAVHAPLWWLLISNDFTCSSLTRDSPAARSNSIPALFESVKALYQRALLPFLKKNWRPLNCCFSSSIDYGHIAPTYLIFWPHLYSFGLK